MGLMKHFLLLSGVLSIFAYEPEEIDADYYFGTKNLRSRLNKLNCDDFTNQFYCKIRCGGKQALCFNGGCYCVYSATKMEAEEQEKKIKKEEINQESVYAFRPTVRHHIAHFCPNLDVARECIQKCMSEGKPAFCGKDHVCYCGHKYKPRDKDIKNNANDTYAAFLDLYEKYFGPTEKNVVDVSDESDED